MKNNRRVFLKSAGLLGTGLAALPLAGLVTPKKVNEPKHTGSSDEKDIQIFNMCGYRAPSLDVVRLGFVELGNRGMAAATRISYIDGVLTNALCDTHPEKVQEAKIRLSKINNHLQTYSGRSPIDLLQLTSRILLEVPGKRTVPLIFPLNTEISPRSKKLPVRLKIDLTIQFARKLFNP